MDRDAAEQDLEFRQLIPYHMVLRAGEYLEYFRTKMSGETRLHSKRSVGIGGHINTEDAGGSEKMEAYIKGSLRELTVEELRIASQTIDNAIVGMINDETTEVGRVHFGVVHIVEIDKNGGVSTVDPAIELSGFMSPRILRCGAPGAEFEAWSDLCLDPNNLSHLTTVFKTPGIRIPIPTKLQ